MCGVDMCAGTDGGSARPAQLAAVRHALPRAVATVAVDLGPQAAPRAAPADPSTLGKTCAPVAIPAGASGARHGSYA